jgi:hypothetical protein
MVAPIESGNVLVYIWKLKPAAARPSSKIASASPEPSRYFLTASGSTR